MLSCVCTNLLHLVLSIAPRVVICTICCTPSCHTTYCMFAPWSWRHATSSQLEAIKCITVMLAYSKRCIFFKQASKSTFFTTESSPSLIWTCAANKLNTISEHVAHYCNKVLGFFFCILGKDTMADCDVASAHASCRSTFLNRLEREKGEAGLCITYPLL